MKCDIRKCVAYLMQDFLLMRKPDRVSNMSNQYVGHVVSIPSPRNVTTPAELKLNLTA
jgi:hypothetical protein